MQFHVLFPKEEIACQEGAETTKSYISYITNEVWPWVHPSLNHRSSAQSATELGAGDPPIAWSIHLKSAQFWGTSRTNCCQHWACSPILLIGRFGPSEIRNKSEQKKSGFRIYFCIALLAMVQRDVLYFSVPERINLNRSLNISVCTSIMKREEW